MINIKCIGECLAHNKGTTCYFSAVLSFILKRDLLQIQRLCLKVGRSQEPGCYSGY